MVTELAEGELGELANPPLWVGSMACMPGAAGREADIWKGWPDARFWIPRTLVIDDGPGQQWLVTTDGELDSPETATAEASDAHPRGRDAYERCVDDAVQAIVNSDIVRKIVVARAARFELPRPPSLSAVFKAARAQEPSAHHLLVHWPGHGTLVGATPERLVALDNHRVTTEALAGTARRGPGQLEALMASDKDRREHAVVVEDIVSALTPLSSNIQAPDTPRPRTLRSLVHLRTPIAATLQHPRHILDLVGRLHPTPAIVGSPATDAGRWLARHEGLDRGHYAGPVGWFDSQGNGDFVIALRSALLRDGQAWAFAGAGVVAGSDPTAEWHETESKLSTALATVTGAASETTHAERAFPPTLPEGVEA